MKNQLNRGLKRRLMYVENKEGDLDGARARIGWVTFSKSGKSIRYRGRSLASSGGRGILGNYYDEASGEEFWVSGVKKDGSNAHPSGSVTAVVDEDAAEAYQAHRASRA